jgi:hypothetical protein
MPPSTPHRGLVRVKEVILDMGSLDFGDTGLIVRHHVG